MDVVGVPQIGHSSQEHTPDLTNIDMNSLSCFNPGTGPTAFEYPLHHPQGDFTSSAAITSTTSNEIVEPRDLQPVDPVTTQVSVSSTSQQLPSRPRCKRKRNIKHQPKYPKYRGLSSAFSAPRDLLSSMMPSDPITSVVTPPPPSVKTSCTKGKPTPSSASKPKPSSASKPKPSSASNPKSSSTSISQVKNKPIQEPPKKKKKGKVTDKPQLIRSETIPIDFLKQMGVDEWMERESELIRRALERKEHFLRNGFGKTSGEPWPLGEPDMKSKPIPSNWAWYVKISVDYDIENLTLVPPKGPAGWLKHGWKRMKDEQKDVFQQLSNEYHDQRTKWIIDHAIGIKNSTQQNAGETSPDIPVPSSSPVSVTHARLDDSERGPEGYKSSADHLIPFGVDHSRPFGDGQSWTEVDHSNPLGDVQPTTGIEYLSFMRDVQLPDRVNRSPNEGFTNVSVSSDGSFIFNQFPNDGISIIDPSQDSTASLPDRSGLTHDVTNQPFTFSPSYLQSQHFEVDFQMALDGHDSTQWFDQSNPNQCILESPITLNRSVSRYSPDHGLSHCDNSTFLSHLTNYQSSPVDSVPSDRSSSLLMTPITDPLIGLFQPVRRYSPDHGLSAYDHSTFSSSLGMSDFSSVDSISSARSSSFLMTPSTGMSDHTDHTNSSARYPDPVLVVADQIRSLSYNTNCVPPSHFEPMPFTYSDVNELHAACPLL